MGAADTAASARIRSAEDPSPRRSWGIGLRLSIVGGGPLCVYAVERLAARLSATATGDRPQPGLGLRIDIFERSGRFGAGEVNNDLQPDTCLLNRVAAQIAFAADESNTTVGALLPASARPNLHAWARAKWIARQDPVYALEPGSIVPRRVHGEALAEAFAANLARLRAAGAEVVCHPLAVVDLAPDARGGFAVICAGDAPGIAADRILLATGNAASFAQGPPPPAEPDGARRIERAYPLERQLDEATVPPGSQVVVRGLGLTAIDVFLHLSEGRGGRFEPCTDCEAGLRYRPSGREPARIAAFSPSGMLPCCRPENFKLLDPALTYRGTFFRPETLQRLRHSRGMPMTMSDGRNVLQLDFDRDVLPLVVLEMARAYYLTLFGPDFDAVATTAARPGFDAFLDAPREGIADPEQTIDRLIAPVQDCFERICAALEATTPAAAAALAPTLAMHLDTIRLTFESVVFAPSPPRDGHPDHAHVGETPSSRPTSSPWGHPLSPQAHRFDWRRLLRPLAADGDDSVGMSAIGDSARDGGAHWRSRLIAFIARDLRNAAQGNLRNPLKAACDGVLRDLRHVFAALVEDGGLTATSHAAFLDGFMRCYHRLSNGAGILALRKTLALIESGLVDIDVGPGASVVREAGGYFIEGPVTGAIRRGSILIEARLPAFDAANPHEPLYSNLLRRGLVRRWTNPAHAPAAAFVPGGLDLSRDFHPYDAHGREDSRLTAMGTPAEGQRLLQSVAARPACGSAIFADLDRWASDILAALPARPSFGEPLQESV